LAGKKRLSAGKGLLVGGKRLAPPHHRPFIKSVYLADVHEENGTLNKPVAGSELAAGLDHPRNWRWSATIHRENFLVGIVWKARAEDVGGQGIGKATAGCVLSGGTTRSAGGCMIKNHKGIHDP